MINADQAEFWTHSAGPAWVSAQVQMDALLQPVLDLVLERAALSPGSRVLDIGCGTGASTLAAAQIVGPEGHLTGLDIAPTMLALAEERLAHQPNTTLRAADAQNHAFEPGEFDAMISRFGVMFFEDTTAAFANLATALGARGTMTLAAWGPASENPWFMEPARAAAEVLGPMPKVDRTLPGPFAFEDSARIQPMLTAAGLEVIAVDQVDLSLTPARGLDHAAALCCQIGPADAALRYHDADAEGQKAVLQAVSGRLAPFDGPQGLRIPAQINLYRLRNPS